MPSPELWLFAKDLRELTVSRAYWLLLLIIGPLTGHAFITAVNFYAEASGHGDGRAALPQGLSPLDGVLVPTFGVYDLAVTLLFPFVAIRMISEEKDSGALKLMLQGPIRMATMLVAKGLTLLAAWLIASIPGIVALLLWKIYGGSLYAPEVLNLLLGHLLRMIVASGVAVAAAAASSSGASAAIVTLGFTIGTWALEFVAMGRGGLLQKLAAYTPTAALRAFEQGQFRLSTVAVSLLLCLASFAFAVLWLPQRFTLRSRLTRSALLVLVSGSAMWTASLLRASWDVSEDHRNSFPKAAEAALRQIKSPFRVTVFLAAEDPRLMDLDRNILSKLERILPQLRVEYAAHSRTGLFEGSDEHYGEIWYELNGRRVMSRSTTEQVVLDTLYELARVHPVAQQVDTEYSGHPLNTEPRGAGWIFYLLWPSVVCLCYGIQFVGRSRS